MSSEEERPAGSAGLAFGRVTAMIFPETRGKMESGIIVHSVPENEVDRSHFPQRLETGSGLTFCLRLWKCLAHPPV
jgi:hypothetical protein